MHWKLASALLVIYPLAGCAVLGDYDYDGYALEIDPCANGDCSWNVRFGDEAEQSVHAVALDDTGNVLVAGSYLGTISFHENMVTTDSAAFEKPYVVEFDPFGKAGCIHNINAETEGQALAVVAAGSKIVWGGYSGPAGMGNAFVRMDDPCGGSALPQSILIGTAVGDVSALLLSDDLSKIYAAGTVQGMGTIDCVDGMHEYMTVAPNLFFAELDAKSGVCNRAHIYTGGQHVAKSIRMAKAGTQLLLAGTYTGTIDTTTIPAMTVSPAIFVLVVDTTTGNIVHANAFRGGMDDGVEITELSAMTMAKDTLFLAGKREGQALLNSKGDMVLSSATTSIDTFIVALDPAMLTERWFYTLGGDDRQLVTGMAAPRANELFLSGVFAANLVFQGKVVESTKCDDQACAYWARLNTDGGQPMDTGITLLSKGEMQAFANTLIATRSSGMVLAASASVEIVTDPNIPLPATPMSGDMDVTVAKLYPVP